MSNRSIDSLFLRKEFWLFALCGGTVVAASVMLANRLLHDPGSLVVSVTVLPIVLAVGVIGARLFRRTLSKDE